MTCFLVRASCPRVRASCPRVRTLCPRARMTCLQAGAICLQAGLTCLHARRTCPQVRLTCPPCGLPCPSSSGLICLRVGQPCRELGSGLKSKVPSSLNRLSDEFCVGTLDFRPDPHSPGRIALPPLSI